MENSQLTFSNDEEAIAYIQRLKHEIEEKSKEIDRVTNMLPIDRSLVEKEVSITGMYCII